MKFGKHSASRSSSRQRLLNSADEVQNAGPSATSSDLPSFFKRFLRGWSRKQRTSAHSSDRSNEAGSFRQRPQPQNKLSIGHRWQYGRPPSLASMKNEAEEAQERFKQLDCVVQTGLRNMACNGITATKEQPTPEVPPMKCGKTMLVKPLVKPETDGISWRKMSWGLMKKEENGKVMNDDSDYSPKALPASPRRWNVQKACSNELLTQATDTDSRSTLDELCPSDQWCPVDNLAVADGRPSTEARISTAMAHDPEPDLRSRTRTRNGSDAETNHAEDGRQRSAGIMTRIKRILRKASGSRSHAVEGR